MPFRQPRRRLDADTLALIDRSPYIFIRAGTKSHKMIAVWVVVVEGRVFVRSWSLKPRSWNRTFRVDPKGAIQVGKRKLRIRAALIRSERLKKEIDRAYLKKYGKGGMLRFAKDLGRPKSRATTTELLPLPT